MQELQQSTTPVLAAQTGKGNIKQSMLQPFQAEAITPRMQQRPRNMAPLKHAVGTVPDRPSSMVTDGASQRAC